jgi:hypothetical protein
VSFGCGESDVFRWIFGTGAGRSRLPGSRSLHRRGVGKRIAPVWAAGERLVRSGWGHISGIPTPKAIRTHKHLLLRSHLSDGSARQQFKAGPIAHSLRAAAAGRAPLLQRTSAAVWAFVPRPLGAGSQRKSSNASPWPPPPQRATAALPVFGRASSWAADTTTRAPTAPVVSVVGDSELLHDDISYHGRALAGRVRCRLGLPIPTTPFTVARLICLTAVQQDLANVSLGFEVGVRRGYFGKWVHPFCYQSDCPGCQEREDKTVHARHDRRLLFGRAVSQQGPKHGCLLLHQGREV